MVSELPFWRGMLGAPSLRLGPERSGQGQHAASVLDPLRDVNGTAGHLTLTLPAGVTEPLLTRVPSAFHGGIHEVLLTGLVLAVVDWQRRQGQEQDRGHDRARRGQDGEDGEEGEDEARTRTGSPGKSRLPARCRSAAAPAAPAQAALRRTPQRF